jgi:hypothetical protein
MSKRQSYVPPNGSDEGAIVILRRAAGKGNLWGAGFKVSEFQGSKQNLMEAGFQGFRVSRFQSKTLRSARSFRSRKEGNGKHCNIVKGIDYDLETLKL